MTRLSKPKQEKRRSIERQLVATLRDKLDALANAQLKEDTNFGKNGNRIVNEYTKQHKKTSKASSVGLKNEIHLLLTACGLHPHEDKEDTVPTTREEKWMIHLDWDGQFRRPDDTDFSEGYVRSKQIACEQQNTFDDEPSFKQSLKEYNLELSPTWQKMAKLQGFASCKGKIYQQLARMKIDPKVLPNLNFFDYSEMLYLWQKEHKKQAFECSRSKNFKMFEACYGNEFTRVMTTLKYKPDFIKKVRENMRNGCGDAILNFHHYHNIFRCQEMDDPSKVNDFSNTILTFVHPHHRTFHFGNGYDIHDDIVFFGGYDPIYQIKRNLERERQYLTNPTLFMAKNAKHNR